MIDFIKNLFNKKEKHFCINCLWYTGKKETWYDEFGFSWDYITCNPKLQGKTINYVTGEIKENKKRLSCNNSNKKGMCKYFKQIDF